MREEYQTERQAAEVDAKPQDIAVQIALPMAEVLSCLEQGLGELVRKLGRLFIESVLEAGSRTDCWSSLASHSGTARLSMGQ